ncbi:uncharacterized protein LOC113378197 [Ctenocephalides felis]|uniref:uncharacterized protein LOC113378197 n=1 Tax=Ctenocephalides felis TaxID=7515 RepID=UPI000E6E5AB3|nr:uncharacterized protein LOC113378197 [Ctenocephalides felis]
MSDDIERIRNEHLAEYEREKRTNPNEWNLSPPQSAQPEYAQKKCWHPIMLETDVPHNVETDSDGKVKDHKQIILNMRHVMGLDRPKEESAEKRKAAAKMIPEMLMYLCQTSVQSFHREPSAGDRNRKVPDTI